MRIAIVNDMNMALEVLRRIIAAAPEHEVAWVARNGQEAVRCCRESLPDLILMDLIMPELNGVEATRQIMASTPCPILVVTSSVTTNAAMVFKAMSYGALDAVSTPILGTSGEEKGRTQLLKKIRTIGMLIEAAQSQSSPSSAVPAKPVSSDEWLIALGASTGGPSALSKILAALPKNLKASVAIVQHVDQYFSQGFVDWLGNFSTLPVRLARAGDRLTPGNVHVSGTNDHLYINEKSLLDYRVDPKYTPYRPSVDVFFKSILENWNGRSAAALLTGMGRDGAEGLLQLKQHGIYTVAQDAKSCRVYGMPKAAAELNAAVDILPIDEIAEALVSRVLILSAAKKSGVKIR